MQDLVSIIVPIYNVEKYVRNSIISICRQTYKNIEVILMDDGSEDNSINIAENEIKNYKGTSISYLLVSQKNKGQGIARNTGVSYAKGEWILFLDSDDVLHPDAVERLLSTAIKYGCDFVFSDFQRVLEKQEFLPGRDSSKIEILTGTKLQYQFLIRERVIIVPGTLYNKKWYTKNRLEFNAIRYSEDQHFLWRAIAATEHVAYIDGVLYNYLKRSNSIMTGSGGEQMKAAYESFKELQTSLEQSPGVITEVKEWMLGRWVLGMLRVGCAILSWADFKELYYNVDGPVHARKMVMFPEGKARLSARFLNKSLRLYYQIFHVWGTK